MYEDTSNAISRPPRRNARRRFSGCAAMFGAVMAAAMAACPAAGAGETHDPYAVPREIIGDFQRITTPNGVEESFVAEINGTRQYVYVRGNDRENPVILFVHGGPAAPEVPISWTFQRPWEEFFTVVHWDQRASGKSFPLNDPDKILPTLTVEQYRDDVIALIGEITRRYGKRKVILIGHSWGSVPGLMTAMERPDLVHAYVGVGQIIDFREGERLGYEEVLRAAREDGNAKAIAELKSIAPYPGAGPFVLKAIDVQRKWSVHYGYLTAGRDNADAYFKAYRLSPEYGPEDIKAWGAGSAFTMKHLFPKLADISFRNVKRIKTPVIMFMGRHDYTTPSALVEAWLDALKAPVKRAVWFEHSAHVIPVDEPGRTLLALLRHVRPIAVKAGDGAPVK